MSLLETKHQKKSMVITSILYVLIFIFLFLVGLTYLDPPPENGVAINFGTTDYGSGDTQPTEPVKTTPQQNIPEPTPQETTTPPQEVVDDVATQDLEEAPVIEEKEKPKEEKEKPVKEKQEKEHFRKKSRSSRLWKCRFCSCILLGKNGRKNCRNYRWSRWSNKQRWFFF